MCAGIHLHLHLPAIYANTHSDSDGYTSTNAHSETRYNTERASYRAAASNKWSVTSER